MSDELIDWAGHREAGDPHTLASVGMAKTHGEMTARLSGDEAARALDRAHKRRVRQRFEGRRYDRRLKCFVAVERADAPPSPRARAAAPRPVQGHAEAPERWTCYCRRTGARLWTVRGQVRHALAEFERLARAQGGGLADLVVRQA